MIFNNVCTPRLVRTLEDHDGAEFGHACCIATLCAPCLLQLSLYCGYGACRFAGTDYFVDLALFGQVYSHFSRFLPEGQRVGRRGENGCCPHLDDLLDTPLAGLSPTWDNK